MDTTIIVKALKSPYDHLTSMISNSLLLLLATAFAFVAVGLDLTGILALPPLLISLLQIVLYALAALIYLRVFGWLAYHLQTVREGSMPTKGSLFARGFWVALVVFIYLIPYQLTLFIYSPVGVGLTVVYLIALVVVLPAIISNTALQNSFAAGFKWKEIARFLSHKLYWLGLVLALVSLMVYSVISYGINYVLLFVGSGVVFYVVSLIAYVLYLFLLLAGLTTAVSFFGQVPVETSKKAGQDTQGVLQSLREGKIGTIKLW